MKTWASVVPLKYKSVFLILILSFLVGLKLYPNDTVLFLTSHTKQLNPKYLSYYFDKNGSQNHLSIVETFKKGKFQKSTLVSPNFGYTRHPIWFHIPLQTDNSQITFYFKLNFAQYNSIDLLIFDNNFNLVSKQEQGVYNFNKNGTYIHHCPLFTINLKEDAVNHLFFKIVNEAPIVFPLEIHTKESLLRSEKSSRSYAFFLFGILIATVLFNVIFFFITRNNAYIFLGLHLLFSLGNFIFYQGYGYEYLFWLNPNTLLFIKFYFFSLSAIFHILFIIKYLELKKIKLLYNISILNLIFFIAFLIITISGLFSVFNIAKMTVSIYLVSPLINVFIAITALFKNNRHARYYLAAYGIHIVAAIIFTLSTMGVFPYALLQLNLQVVAMVLFGVLLSIGLTEQFTLSRIMIAANTQLEKDKKFLINEIEERKKIEKALTESEQKFRLLFELLPHPMILTDFETGLILDVNNTFCKISGYDKYNLINNHTTKIGFWSQEIRESYINELLTNGKITGKQMVLFTQAQKTLSVLMYSEIIKITNEKRIITIIVDISELKKQEKALQLSEKQLKNLNKTKDKFFSVIAHDLQNPLNVLIAYTKQAINLHNEKNFQKTATYLSTIQSIAETTGNLIQNLLTWARIQTGLSSFKPEQIKALHLLEGELIILKSYIESKDLEIKIICPDDLIITGDINMLRSIIRNLISNAIKFSHPKGIITVKFENNEIQNIITVSDMGIGISETLKKNLFKIGELVHTKGTNNEMGTGLGLILCAEFISLHRGNIEVESTLGKGSKFIVTWPKLLK